MFRLFDCSTCTLYDGSKFNRYYLNHLRQSQVSTVSKKITLYLKREYVKYKLYCSDKKNLENCLTHL